LRRIGYGYIKLDFWEALTLGPAQDIVPEMIILGVDPEDIESLSLELTAATQSRVDLMIDMVLDALTRFGGSC
jgi:hydrogenase maturation protease